jgi:hypothetical protein
MRDFSPPVDRNGSMLSKNSVVSEVVGCERPVTRFRLLPRTAAWCLVDKWRLGLWTQLTFTPV